MSNNQSISENNYKLGDLNKEYCVTVKNRENLENKSFSLKNETFKSNPDSYIKLGTENKESLPDCNDAINEKVYQDLKDRLEGVPVKLKDSAGEIDGDGQPVLGDYYYNEYLIKKSYEKFLEDAKKYQGTDEERYGKALVDLRKETRGYIPEEVRRIYEQLVKEDKIQHIFIDKDFEIIYTDEDRSDEYETSIFNVIYKNVSDHNKYCLGYKIEPGKCYQFGCQSWEYKEDKAIFGAILSCDFDRLKIAKEILEPNESEYDEE